MKKREVLFVFISIFLIMSISFVSAGLLQDIEDWFKDFFNMGADSELKGELDSYSGYASGSSSSSSYGGYASGSSSSSSYGGYNDYDYVCDEVEKICEKEYGRGGINFIYYIKECQNNEWVEIESCELNQECKDGECVELPIRYIEPDLCNDSDDGKDYYVKGNVYSTVGPHAPESGTDGCLNENLQYIETNGVYLSEVFCNNKSMYENEVVLCLYGCDYGACKDDYPEISCEDSDSGINSDERGYVHNLNDANSPKIYDECTTDAFGQGEEDVKEVYCNHDDMFDIEFVVCPYGCDDGRCISPIEDFTISVATLKNTYIVGEIIELTDPPEEEWRDYKTDYIVDTPFSGDSKTSVEYEGYIIQFKDKSVIEEKIERLRQIKQDRERIEKSNVIFRNTIGRLQVQILNNKEKTVDSNLKDYKRNLKNKNLVIKNNIKKKLNKNLDFNNIVGHVVNEQTEIQVMNEFTDVFNGIALDISDEEAEKIKELDDVRKIYLNKQTESLLMDSVPLIKADDVWRLDEDSNNCNETLKSCLTGEGVTIAIIDTGVDYTHQDLGGCFGEGCKVVGGYDFYNNDNDPMDDNGHGTHCAGIAAGNGRLKGVAPDAKIYAYKISDSGGYGWYDNLISAVERSVDPNNDGDFSDRVDVISLSFGGSAGDDPTTDATKIAVDNAVDAGIVVSAAVGNEWGEAEYQTIICPACSEKVISVGSSDKNDKISYFSAKGPNLISYSIKPEILAPGQGFSRSQGICSAQWNGAYSWADTECNSDDNHVAIRGTSMATPHVSGVVALLKQKNPDWTPEEIKSILIGSAEIIPPVEVNVNICNDTDGGINPAEKGRMIGRYDYEDYCVGSEQLVEMYCDYEGGLLKYYEYVNCSEYGGRCESGECIENTTSMPFTLKNPQIGGYKNYDVYTSGSGRVDILKAIDNSILVLPSILNLGFIDDNKNSLEDNFTIKNIGNKRLGIRLITGPLENIQYHNLFDQEISFSDNDFCLEVGSEEVIDFYLNTEGLTNGFYSGRYKLELYSDCNFEDYLKTNILPIGFSKLNKLKFKFIDDPSTTYHYHAWQFRLPDDSIVDYTLKEYTTEDISEYEVYTPYEEFDLLLYVMEYSSKDKFNVRIFLKHIITSENSEIIFDVSDTEQIFNIIEVLENKNMDVARLEVSLLSDTPDIAFWEEFYNIEWYDYQSWEVKIKSDTDLLFSDYNLIVGVIAKLKDYDYNTSKEFFVLPSINHYPFIDNDTIDILDIKNVSIKFEKTFIDEYNNFYRFGVTPYAPSLDDSLGLYVDPIAVPKNITLFFRDDCLSCKYRIWGELWDPSSYIDPYIFKEYWNGREEVYWPGNDKLTDLSFFEDPFSLKLSTEYCIPNRIDMCNDGLVRGILHDNFIPQSYAMSESTLGTLYITLPDGTLENVVPDEPSGYYSARGAWVLNCDSPSYSFPQILEDTSKFCQIGDYKIEWIIDDLIKNQVLTLNKIVNYDGDKFTILNISESICGNNISEGTEECDGIDDFNCLDRCSQTCTCLPESKIMNNMGVDLTGNLKLILQKESEGSWVDERVTIDEQITISSQGLIKLDIGEDNQGNQIFEGFNNLNVIANEAGGYRVYVSFETNGEEIENSWEFEVEEGLATINPFKGFIEWLKKEVKKRKI